jgi:hypothetical protein
MEFSELWDPDVPHSHTHATGSGARLASDSLSHHRTLGIHAPCVMEGCSACIVQSVVAASADIRGIARAGLQDVDIQTLKRDQLWPCTQNADEHQSSFLPV